jgi:Spy/CpxP family protein refolding chaperone
MKKANIIFIAVIGLMIAVGCSQSSKTQKSTSESQEQQMDSGNEMTNEEGTGSLTEKMADANPSDRIGTQLDQLNMSLTEDQKNKMNEISNKYDFNNVSNQQERKAMRDQMMNEINNVLTPEQRAKLDESKKARKDASGN